MALGSQASNVEAMSALTGLTHDIFVGEVLPNVRTESPTAMCFQDAGPGQYRLEGQNMVYAADLRFSTGALATDGNIPDHQGLDPVQGKLTPIRRYRRIALDNLTEQRASGPGTYQEFSDRLFDLLWDSWKRMEIRHAVGPATGLLGACSSRTSSTVFVIKDAFGNVGTNPVTHISEGSVLCWYDLTATAAIDGAAVVSLIAYSTSTITMDSATTWEPADTLAADDLIYFATTNNISTDYFTAERNLAPNGVGTILDPTAALTTVFNISESTYPRHKPFRKSSTTFDHLELTEHWLQLASKRGFAVTPQMDVVVTFPSCVAQIARSLMGYQQQAYTGDSLRGGYSTVTVSGIPILEDYNFYHNVAATLCKDYLYRINLGGDADMFSDDGSQWSRIADFDGKEAFVGEYMNCFSGHRGANSALTGITTDLTDADFSSVPDY